MCKRTYNWSQFFKNYNYYISNKIIVYLFRRENGFCPGTDPVGGPRGFGPPLAQKKKKVIYTTFSPANPYRAPLVQPWPAPQAQPKFKKKYPLTLLTLQTDSDKIIIKKFKKINERDREKSRETETEREWLEWRDWERVLSTDYSHWPTMAPHKPLASHDTTTSHHHAT